MLQQRRWARRWLYATTCDLWQPSLASSAAVEVVGRLLLSRRTPLSEHKMWLETTGREFDQEVIEQLAVTPKFVVRGEVLPSYGHRSGIATSLQLFIAVTKLVSNFCWISSLRTRWTVTLFCRRWARLSANG
jgi:hypothetical protein